MVFGRIPPNIQLHRDCKRVPKYSFNEGSLAATIYTIREIVANYKILEDKITKAWSKRGISWNIK